MGQGFSIFAWYCIQSGSLIVLAWLILGRREGSIRFGRVNLRAVLWGTAAAVALGVVAEPVTELFPDKYLDRLGMVMSGGAWAVVTSVVVAPIAEEVLFRGIIQRWLVKKTGMWPGILIAAAVFGAAHIVPQQIVVAAATGVALGYIYKVTGSLSTAIVVHAANNALSHIMFAFTGDVGTTVREAAGNDAVYAAVYLLCTLLVILSIIKIKKLSLQGCE